MDRQLLEEVCLWWEERMGLGSGMRAKGISLNKTEDTMAGAGADGKVEAEEEPQDVVRSQGPGQQRRVEAQQGTQVTGEGIGRDRLVAGMRVRGGGVDSDLLPGWNCPARGAAGGGRCLLPHASWSLHSSLTC